MHGKVGHSVRTVTFYPLFMLDTLICHAKHHESMQSHIIQNATSVRDSHGTNIAGMHLIN